MTPFALVLDAGRILAAAGGGSSGFGGGGGGGGGGFSGGGGGSYGGGGGGGGAFIVLVIVGVLVFFAISTLLELRRRKRRRERVDAVRLASARAADDDPAFAADVVEPAAAELFRRVQVAWTGRDRVRLAHLLGPDLLVEWERRLDDFERKGWHNVCEVRSGPRIEYVGMVNAARDEDDRVTVRVEATLRDVVVDRGGRIIRRNEEDDDTTELAEYWTLAKRDGGWTLRSIEQDAEGGHHLTSAIIAAPWEDTEGLRDASATELAVADAIPDRQLAEVADLDFEGEARVAAMDLSVVDGRFAPDVLEAAARRAVAAWAEAVDGEDGPLEAVATPEAVAALLHPDGPGSRLVVRGPRLRALRIVSVDAATKPATMRVEAEVSGRRYLEDRDTAAVLSGSKGSEATFREEWTMGLAPGAGADGGTPWRILRA